MLKIILFSILFMMSIVCAYMLGHNDGFIQSSTLWTDFLYVTCTSDAIIKFPGVDTIFVCNEMWEL